MSRIAANIAAVRARIAAAAARAGRDPRTVRLMAITKTVEAERIAEAVVAGVELIGENYVQEAKTKIERLGPIAEWRLTGHLQTNKAKYVVRLFDAVESVDRQDVADELNRRAAAAGRVLPVLIEVNIAGEDTKRGVAPAAAAALLDHCRTLPALAVQGLMGMAPRFDDPEQARPYFAAVRRLRDTLAAPDLPLTELSMGMTGDFEVAVEEGATIVRIGRALFGDRG